MPKPPPVVGEVNKFGESWDGSRWTPASAGSSGMLNLPTAPRNAGARTDDQDIELLKQFLTTGGTLAGGALLGPPGAVLGGAAGRMLGHVPEAMVSSATENPNESSFAEDAALGAGEGALQEAFPWLLGKTMSGAAKLGKMLPPAADWMAWPAYARSAAGPLEKAGAAIGKPTSSHTRSALDWLTKEEPTPVSHFDSMAGQGERYAQKKAAQASQDSALDRVRQPPQSYTDRARIPNSPRGPINPADDVFGNYQPFGPSPRPPVKVEPSSALDALLSDEPAVSLLDRPNLRNRTVLEPDEFSFRDLQDRIAKEKARRGGMQSAAKALKD